ncbi:MAG: EamA family transporter, partial [Anaerolineales bacterium]|nr:EamA family transporter [Anaerolineales bacterium]
MSTTLPPVPERKAKPLAAPLFVILASMLWGTTGTSQALAPEGATPASVGVVRMVIGGLALLLALLLQG